MKRGSQIKNQKTSKDSTASKSSRSSANSTEKTLDVLTSDAIKNSGGSNVLQAEYYKEVAFAVMNSNSPSLYFAKPTISKIQSKEWQQSYLFVIKYLKKYGMTNTLEAIQLENPKVAKTLRGNKCQFVFDELMGTSEDLGDRSFRYRVDSFFDEHGLQLPENPYAFSMSDDIPDGSIQKRQQVSGRANIVKPVLKE